MRSRLDEIPVLRTQVGEIPAAHYNRLRLALLRLGSPLRLELPKLRHLDLVVTEEAWVCVDRMLYDLPVVAWLDFAQAGRTALHEPVACTIRIFHAHADLVIPTVFAECERVLRKRLAAARPGPGRWRP